MSGVPSTTLWFRASNVAVTSHTERLQSKTALGQSSEETRHERPRVSSRWRPTACDSWHVGSCRPGMLPVAIRAAHTGTSTWHVENSRLLMEGRRSALSCLRSMLLAQGAALPSQVSVNSPNFKVRALRHCRGPPLANRPL